MDYVPRPPDAEIEALPVPYLASIEYDFGGFESFPQRHGFMQDGSLDTARTAAELASLLQAWLYFGLIAECIGRPVTVAEFVNTSPHDDSYRVVVATDRLFECINDWIHRLRKLSLLSPKWIDCVSHAGDTIVFAIHASSWFDYIDGMDEPQCATIAMSVKCLIITLVRLYRLLEPSIRLNEYSESLKPWHATGDLTMPYPARYLHALMTKRGWCPTLVRRICKRHDYTAAIFLLQMNSFQGSASHESCTSNTCIALHVNEKTYQTRHAEGNCNCNFVVADTSKIASLIKAGRIPIVSVKLGQGNQLEISAAEWVHDPPTTNIRDGLFNYRGPFRSYAAISHVWADGLGNPSENSIPLCQFKRIAERVKWGGRQDDSWARSAQYFWMDTLCIPVAESHAATRVDAIDQMAMVYACASQVIVLDSALSHCPFPKLGPVVWKDPILTGVENLSFLALRSADSYLAASCILGRILCSPWAGRSWTLQEAVLPDHVHFALKTGSLNSAWLRTAAQTGQRSKTARRRDVEHEDMFQNPLGMLVRLYRVAVGLACVRQAFDIIYLHGRSQTPCRRGARQGFSRFVRASLGIPILMMSIIGALEIACMYLAAFLVLFALSIGLGLAASAVMLLPGLLFLSFDVWKNRRMRNEWLEKRWRTNDIRQLLCCHTFKSMVYEVRHMLHEDNKTLMESARGAKFKASKLRCSHFLRVWESLAERSTSKPEDVPYILASLSHLRVQPLKTVSERDRMTCILNSFEELPAGLLFLPEDPHGHRSIQSSSSTAILPSTPCGDRIMSTATMRMQPNRLSFLTGDEPARLALILLENVLSATSTRTILVDNTSACYRVHGVGNAGHDHVDRATDVSKGVAIVMAQPQRGVQSTGWSTFAAVFGVVQQDGSELHLRFLRHVEIRSVVRQAVIQEDPGLTYFSGRLVKEAMHCHVLAQHEPDAKVEGESVVPESDVTASLAFDPPFELLHTQAHRTLMKLVIINTTPIYGYVIRRLHRERMHSSYGLMVFEVAMATAVWLLLSVLPIIVNDQCRAAAWEQHYGTARVKPPGRMWRAINVHMNAWDAAIVANLTISENQLRTVEQQVPGITLGWDLARGKGSVFDYLMGQQAEEALLTEYQSNIGDLRVSTWVAAWRGRIRMSGGGYVTGYH